MILVLKVDASAGMMYCAGDLDHSHDDAQDDHQILTPV